MDTDNQVSTIIRTLVGSGFQLDNVSSKPSHLVLRAYRTDEFGIRWRYVIAYTGGNTLSGPAIAGLRKVASNDKASLVIIGTTRETHAEIPVISLNDFVGRMGGSIPSFLPLESEYAAHLSSLGLNKRPSGITGRTDDLFEAYVHAGLQFILQRKVIRYGQERLFEVVPDGLVFGRDSLQLLYDCKAYAKGYPISRDSIRQFADYVRNFHSRYERYVGRLHAFLVISGKFKSEGTLEERARELYSECQVPLVFMSADTMGNIVSLLASAPVFRQSIDWKIIFSATIVNVAAVKKDLAARRKDGVIRS